MACIKQPVRRTKTAGRRAMMLVSKDPLFHLEKFRSGRQQQSLKPSCFQRANFAIGKLKGM